MRWAECDGSCMRKRAPSSAPYSHVVSFVKALSTQISLCGKWSLYSRQASDERRHVGATDRGSLSGCYLWTRSGHGQAARDPGATLRAPISLPSRWSPSIPTRVFTTPIPSSSDTTPASHHLPLLLPGRRVSCRHCHRRSWSLIQESPTDYSNQVKLRPCRALVSTACASALMPVLDTYSCARARPRAISARTGNTACAENQPTEASAVMHSRPQSAHRWIPLPPQGPRCRHHQWRYH